MDGWPRLALGGWLFGASPLALILAAAVATTVQGVVGVLAMIVIGLASVAFASAALLLAGGPYHRARVLTPQKIIEYKGAQKPVGPGLIARRIVECSRQIRLTLYRKPSEVEAEMCVLGYAKCRNDLLSLEETIAGELPGSSPVQRLKLRVALRVATGSVCRTGEAFPEALRVPGQRR